MGTHSKNAWTREEDIILAEITLFSIKRGATQLLAFQEVGQRLSRTPEACGFRWNSKIRKQYKKQIELAKKDREKKLAPTHETQEKKQMCNTEPNSLDLPALSACIQLLYSLTTTHQSDEKEIHKLEKKVMYLIAENEKLLQKKKELGTLFNKLSLLLGPTSSNQ